MLWLKRYTEAIAANEESIARLRLLGDAYGEAICLTNLGAICYAFDPSPGYGRLLAAGTRPAR
jgi:hypothetical protein